MADISQIEVNGTTYDICDATARDSLSSSLIASITRSGTTFTAKNAAGTALFTFTQQDNNTTYSNATTSAAGLMSAADKTKVNKLAINPNYFEVSTSSTDFSIIGATASNGNGFRLLMGKNGFQKSKMTNGSLTNEWTIYPIKVYDFSVTTVTNNGVSPWGAYVEKEYSNLYIWAINSWASSTNPSSVCMVNHSKIQVYSKTAATVYLRAIIDA